MTTLTIGTTVGEVLALVDELEELTHARRDLRTLSLLGTTLALDEGADDELVTATLLHDIGRAHYLARAAPGIPHEEVGRRFVAERFSPRVEWLVSKHVVAQRWLATVDPEWIDSLTGPQRTSLRRHGGPLSPQAALRFEGSEHAADAVRLRRWADRAVTVALRDPDLDAIGMAMAGAWTT